MILLFFVLMLFYKRPTGLHLYKNHNNVKLLSLRNFLRYVLRMVFFLSLNRNNRIIITLFNRMQTTRVEIILSLSFLQNATL